MSTKQQKCDGCEFSCSVIKVTIYRNSEKETAGFICCHQSEKVRANNIFTGKTSPRWCPLKNKEAKE